MPKICPSRSNVSKQFQTKPEIPQEVLIESTVCNYTLFKLSQIWTENPRGASQAHSILALGTIIKSSRVSALELFVFEVCQIRVLDNIFYTANFVSKPDQIQSTFLPHMPHWSRAPPKFQCVGLMSCHFHPTDQTP